MTNDSKRVTYLCEKCGSDQVTLDAWAEWNVERQAWVLGATYDHTYCHKCDGETHLVEVELAPATA
jgi:Zn finger protein HypA/HybF involved in hydrogenase expression